MIKERFKKDYRHPILDQKLSSKRILQEVRCMAKAGKHGIPVPMIYLVDDLHNRIFMEWVDGRPVRDVIEDKCVDKQTLCQEIGKNIAKLHNLNIIHGDLTTSNILLREKEAVMIDFGLAYVSSLIEDKAVDLYVLERAFQSTHPNSDHIVLFF